MDLAIAGYNGLDTTTIPETKQNNAAGYGSWYTLKLAGIVSLSIKSC